jgi:hypothetical protein
LGHPASVRLAGQVVQGATRPSERAAFRRQTPPGTPRSPRQRRTRRAARQPNRATDLRVDPARRPASGPFRASATYRRARATSCYSVLEVAALRMRCSRDHIGNRGRLIRTTPMPNPERRRGNVRGNKCAARCVRRVLGRARIWLSQCLTPFGGRLGTQLRALWAVWPVEVRVSSAHQKSPANAELSSCRVVPRNGVSRRVATNPPRPRRAGHRCRDDGLGGAAHQSLSRSARATDRPAHRIPASWPGRAARRACRCAPRRSTTSNAPPRAREQLRPEALAQERCEQAEVRARGPPIAVAPQLVVARARARRPWQPQSRPAPPAISR